MSEAPATYIYRWNRHGRKGQPCKVTARSPRGKGFHNFNSICVEFADGYTMVTSGNAEQGLFLDVCAYPRSVRYIRSFYTEAGLADMGV